jgi:hypothetical protein
MSEAEIEPFLATEKATTSLAAALQGDPEEVPHSRRQVVTRPPVWWSKPSLARRIFAGSRRTGSGR